MVNDWFLVNYNVNINSMLKNITQQMRFFVFVLRLNHLHICSVIILYYQNQPFITFMKSIKNIKSTALQSLLAMALVVMFAFSASAQSKIAGWERIYTFPGEQLAEAKDVVQTRDEGFAIISQDNSNRFRIIKTDPDGDIIWEKRYGGLPLGDNVNGRKIIQTQDGGYAVLANCSSCGTIDGTQNIIIFRLDRYGESIWETIFGLTMTDIDTGVSIKETSDGGFIIGGVALTVDNQEQSYFKKIDENGADVFEAAYGNDSREFIRDVEETEDGFIATGYRTMAGDEDLYLIKLNTAGDSLWSVAYGNGSRNEGHAITFTYDANNEVTGYIAAGFTATLSNGDDVYLVQVNTNGDEISTKVLPGGTLADQAYDIQNTRDGGYILTGITEPSAIQSHALLTKIDANLEIEWTEDFGIQTAGFAASQGLSVQPTKDGGYAVVGFQSDANDFNQTYSYLLKTNSEGQIFSNYLEGRVFNQSDNEGIEDWIIVAYEQGGAGRSFFATSEADGTYEMLLTTGSYDVSVITPNNYWEPTIGFSVNIGLPRLTLDFPIAASETSCTDLEVDISTPYLVPGSASVYTVRYCNHGNELAIGAFVDVKLDENLIVLGSSIPNQQVGDIYRFAVGNIDFGDCEEFTIETVLQNTIEAQQTHCVEAEIFPNTICEENDPAWDGSSIGVTAICDETGVQDSVRFQIRNQGNDDMQSPLGIIIIEDIVMRDQPQPGLLSAGEVFDFAIPAEGATYRITAEQATGHPGDSRPTAAIEGCGGFTPGNYTRFSEDDYNYANELDCQENVPNPLGNSKRGYPKGAGDSLLVAGNADMIYHLKFQNTGQDTAIRVVIRDTISSNLDPTTIRPGASSHDYDFEVYAGGILKFTFEDILLPGSSTDEAGSHIYVKYRISQKPNNQVGTPLANGTAITFEFNEPERLIDSLNFVGGLDFLVSTDHIFYPELEAVNVFPNPFSEATTFELVTTETFRQLQFTLYDVMGREVKRINFSGNRFELQRSDLTNGMYIYRIESNGNLLSTGKVITQ